MLVYLVAYTSEDGRPYACAFSTPVLARAFAAARDGEVIETSIDCHADMIETEQQESE